MPCYPFTAGELDESKTLIELCMHLDDGDDSDVELAEDLLLMAAEPLQRGSKQEIGPEKLSLERLRREAAERGTDGDDPSPTLYYRFGFRLSWLELAPAPAPARAPAVAVAVALALPQPQPQPQP